MRAINHALTGAIIGLVVVEPLAAVPLSVVSHYICDAIPHTGFDLPVEQELRSKLFRNLLYLDFVLCVGLVLILATFRPAHWLLAAVCAFAAASPDFFSFNRYINVLNHRAWHTGWYTRFASAIQWFEHPIGALVDVAWFIAGVVLLIPFLR